MSDTIRTDRDGVKRKEGLHKKQKVYIYVGVVIVLE